jgi:antitoxin component YwqK of YwqJK toxin-antitoxin module
MRNHCLQYYTALILQIVLSQFAFNYARAHCPSAGDSTFKDWYYTPSSVHGRIPLTKLTNRSYIRISQLKPDEYVVSSFNPAGITLSNTHLQFISGKLASIAIFNRWNELIDSVWFRITGENEFFVTEKLKGQNPNAPCLGLRYVYKNDLLRDIYCMKDSDRVGYNKEGVAHYAFERYDDPNRFAQIKSESFFGEIDEWVISRKSDCHKILTVYDENDNLISRSIFGIHDEPVTDRFGNCLTKMRYDKNYEEIETAFFDAKGIAWNDYLGCAKRVYDYAGGFIQKETYYRSDYSITRSRIAADSVGFIKYKRDAFGDIIEKLLFDEQGLPVNNWRGIHRYVWFYNEAGMVIEFAFFDKKAFPASDEFGMHRYKIDRNDKGQVIARSTFDKRDQPVADLLEGAILIKYQYDNWGRSSSNSYWVNDSLKMSNRAGHQEIDFSYDPAGMIARIEYLDDKKRPNANAQGFSAEEFSYNAQELLAERKFLLEGRPALLKDSTHPVSYLSSIRYDYDFFNRVYSLEYFDDSGRAVNARLLLKSNEATYCHKIEFGYSETQVISETLYDAGNNPIGNKDCRQENCVLTSGSGLQFRNNSESPKEKTNRSLLNRIAISDSLLFSDQVGFFGKDSILLFLNEKASGLAGTPCATFYRKACVNKYYQFNGIVSDYYLENDSPATRLHYDNGMLNGQAIYYFKNGSIKEKGEYHANQRVGTWEYYYENGLKCKTIEFTETGKRLTEYFAANGAQLVSNGNGVFTGPVIFGSPSNTIPCTATGNVKDGWQDGEWKLYVEHSNNPLYTEKFSTGKFDKGTAYGISGSQKYKGNSVISFESIHPEEQIDYYGQNPICTLIREGNRKSYIPYSYILKDFYPEIHQGIERILKSNRYKDYAGWVFLYILFDSNGQIKEKFVQMYQQNDELRTEFIKLLDGWSGQPTMVNNSNIEYSKFYTILVEDNQYVIPEELLRKSRSVIK